LLRVDASTLYSQIGQLYCFAGRPFSGSGNSAAAFLSASSTCALASHGSKQA
jgi:hypothetical protein